MRSSKNRVVVLAVLVAFALVGNVGASSWSSQVRPPTNQQQRYSADCIQTEAQDEVWSAYWANWLVLRQDYAEHYLRQLSPLCRHRAEVLSQALDTCWDRYEEATGEYFWAILEDGDYLNDWRGHLPRSCAWSAESVGYSIAHWFEGYVWQAREGR